MMARPNQREEALSIRRAEIQPTFTIFVGTEKNLELTVIDPDTNNAKDLVDTNVYATGVAKIYKPDGTQVGGDMTITFEDRANGIVSFIVTATHTALANAGNWYGEIEFSNTTPQVIDQQIFGIDIIESY